MCGNFEEFSLTHMCMKFGLVSYNVLKSPLCHHQKVGVFMVCISIMEFPSADHGSGYLDFPQKVRIKG